MRGQTVTTLLALLKAEIGASQDASNTASDATYQILLSNKQRWLCAEYDWPFMEHRWDVTLAAGNRFISLPTTTSSTDDLNASLTINFERPVEVKVQWSNWWQPVEYGISESELNWRRSSAGESSDPVLKWDFATNTAEAASADKIQIWPIPGTAQTLRIVGQREPITISSGSSKFDLDDMLLVLFVAAELLARHQQADAQLKASLAQERLVRLRGSYPQPSRRLVFGGQNISSKRVVSIGNY